MCYSSLLHHWLSLALQLFWGWLFVLRFGIQQQFCRTIVLIINLALSRCLQQSRIRVRTMEGSPGHCLPLWYETDCHKCLVTNYWGFVTISNQQTLPSCNWRVQIPTLYPEKKESVSTSLMWSNASCTKTHSLVIFWASNRPNSALQYADLLKLGLCQDCHG